MDDTEILCESRMMRKEAYKKREARSWIFSIAAAVVVALTLRFFVFEFVRVDGESMEPTLYTNEYVFMEKVTYWFSGPQRGDIVICSFPNHTDTYVKRVIGVAGDRLRITGGVLYVNGEETHDYFQSLMNTDLNEVTVPQGYVFVMGDNRNNSTDSRSVGALSGEMIHGKAIFVIWPFGKIHGV